MTIFCTKCGTSNEDGAGFCDNCGAKLRPPSGDAAGVDTTTSLPAGKPRDPGKVNASVVGSKKIAYMALASVLVFGGGATYFVLKPPSASASTLLAAAKAGYGKEIINQLKDGLCIENIDYSEGTFNAAETDQRTRAWLDALVTAGLYRQPVAISSGGIYAQTLMQYVATPELEKYRQGRKLCVAKDVEVADVTDIQKIKELTLSRNGKPLKIRTVEAKLTVKSLNTAPWMEKPEVRDAVMKNIRTGWEFKDKILQQEGIESFGLKGNQWVTQIAFDAELAKEDQNAKRGNKNSAETEGNVSSKGSPGGWLSELTSLFSFGHPLKGTWRSAATKVMGAPIPAGSLPEFTFTSSTMESGGQSVEVVFSVDGKNVKVTPKGQNQGTIFVMDGPDNMTVGNPVLGSMRYERVK